MVAGFDLPDAGRIVLDGQDLADRPPERRPVRTVFQSYALFPHMTVEGNVAFPLQMARVPASEMPAKIAAALEDVRLTGFGKRMPHELSGGQRQRVAIARALVTHPTRAAARRAARGARREAARGDADRAHQPAARRRHHVRLRDARPDRGARAVAPDRGDEPRARRAGGRAVADLRSARDALRRGLHRPVQPPVRARSSGTRATSRRSRSPASGRCAPRRRPAARARRGTVALRPEKIRIVASAPQDTPDNHVRGSVADLLYMGDVTVYKVATEAARASRHCSRTRRAGARNSSRSATRSR